MIKNNSIYGFLFLALFSVSSLAEGTFNELCKTSYRTSALSLIDSIVAFQEQQMSSTELAAFTAMEHASLKALRGSCYFTESYENKVCVRRYKEVYDSVRTRIELLPLALGNQSEVDYGFFRNLGVRAKLSIIDINCLR